MNIHLKSIGINTRKKQIIKIKFFLEKMLGVV